MEEQGNQAEVMSIDDIEILPEGFNEETGEIDEIEETAEVDTVEEAAETDEEEVETEEETTEAEETDTKLSELLGFEEIKVNHETKSVNELSADDVKAAIQKGMAYDGKVEKIQGKMKEATEMSGRFEDVAKLFEMDTNQLIESLEQQYFDFAANRDKRNVEDVKKDYLSDKKTNEQKMIEKFVDKFPGVDADSLPEEVKESMALGEDLVNAYEMHLKGEELKGKDTEIQALKDEVAELKKQVKVNKQNEKTKKRGVVGKVDGGEDIKDDFLQGLFGE